MIITNKSQLEQLCIYAQFEKHRRGEVARCKNKKITKEFVTQCSGTICDPTGHGGDDSYIDSEAVMTCRYRRQR